MRNEDFIFEIEYEMEKVLFSTIEEVVQSPLNGNEYSNKLFLKTKIDRLKLKFRIHVIHWTCEVL